MKANITIQVTMTVEAASVARIEEIVAEAEMWCQQVDRYPGVIESDTFVDDWEDDDGN
ncbi:hypothetical protein P9273_32120 [Mesorhizobium sp. WSM4935]|uniref:hypothetical protein n=1 Tax=Mesorhizobium sp. WSM4935 TaxID=3038547 RepID=UPI002414F640|nr:hypothetical protein [Mesorhizobium sp. WSM4935]MDG4879706.1 hypothetical protein [Mesorhizobium sp. WSM4935]